MRTWACTEEQRAAAVLTWGADARSNTPEQRGMEQWSHGAMGPWSMEQRACSYGAAMEELWGNGVMEQWSNGAGAGDSDRPWAGGVGETSPDKVSSSARASWRTTSPPSPPPSAPPPTCSIHARGSAA